MSGDGRVHELLMPRLSDTMTEGIVRVWLKAPGDPVARGEAVAEVETDKVTVELEAPCDGVLLAALVPDGDAIPPGGLVGLVGPEGAAFQLPEAEPDVPVRPTPVAGAGGGPAPATSQVDVRPGGVARRSASPLARRLAADHGVDLAALGAGSGPDGRILRQDVERAIDAAAVAPGAAALADGDEIVQLTSLQRTVARRLTAAKQEIPHYYVDAQVDVTRLVELREAARTSGRADAPFTAYLTRAVALALRDVPRVNASWADGAVVLRAAVDVGLAVGLEDEGLVVPVIRGADTLSVPEIAARATDLVARARAGLLAADELHGGTFTISNLGGFGVTTFHAVVNPPESGILAVGSIRRVPAFEGEQLVARDVVHISLSADHRVFSGMTAAAFVRAVARRLEEPGELLGPGSLSPGEGEDA